MKKIIGWIILILIAGFLLIQFVPFGPQHQNPPVVSEPKWDSPQTRALAKRACFDCHSNETTWPWYSNLAPASWLLQNDVNEGRSYMNFSTWGQGQPEADEIARMLESGRMPPAQYLLMHPEARLTAAEKEALLKGLTASVGAGGEGGEGSEGSEGG